MSSPRGLNCLAALGSIFVLILHTQSVAAEALQADLRFNPSRTGSVWVGEQVELNLELLSNGFSFSGQQFLLPEVSGAYLLQPDSSTVNLTEQKDGETWQGLRYTIMMFPHRAGRIVVPSFQVGFSVSAGYGSEPTAFQISTPRLEIETRMPPGADSGSLLVTSDDFSMSHHWEPGLSVEESLQLKVGDALTLQLTRSAHSVPGMVFSPLPDLSTAGLQAYPAAPQVNDRMNRGELRGSRTDRVTFICEREGQFEIPPIVFQWWDPEKEILNEEVIQGVSLDVVANPAFDEDSAIIGSTSMASLSKRELWIGTAIVLIAVLGIWKSSGLLKKKRDTWKARKEGSEAWAFRQAMRSCRSGKPAEAYQAINRWLAQSEHRQNTLLALAQDSKQEKFVREAESLQSAVIMRGDGQWDGSKLSSEMKRYRSGYVSREKLKEGLPPLNP